MAGWGMTREKNGNWKGGRSIASNGYVIVRVGVGHHLADVRGYAYEHRLVAEKKIGRRLRKGEQVHHRDGNRKNNEPSNIEVAPSRAHHAVHHRTPKNEHRLRMPGEPNWSMACRCGCGSTFDRFDRSGRPRSYLPGHNIHPVQGSSSGHLLDGVEHRAVPA